MQVYFQSCEIKFCLIQQQTLITFWHATMYCNFIFPLHEVFYRVRHILRGSKFQSDRLCTALRLFKMQNMLNYVLAYVHKLMDRKCIFCLNGRQAQKTSEKRRDLLSHNFFKSILPSTSCLHNLLPPLRDLNHCIALDSLQLSQNF